MKKIIYLFLFVVIAIPLYSQSFWQAVENHEIATFRDQSVEMLPVAYSSFLLDMESMSEYLATAPVEFSEDSHTLLMDIPMPDGSLRRFDVKYSPVMQAGLAAKYPKIRSFKAVALDDPSVNMRFNISPRGFRAAINGEKNIYIDPISTERTEAYIVYYTKDYQVDISEVNLSCGLDPYDILDEDLQAEAGLDPFPLPDEELSFRTSEVCDSVPLYTYRLALSCTGEWAKAHGNTVESALADMVTSVNRLNQIYENEFAIRLLLVDDNDKLIWLDPETDPFPVANTGYALLGINTSVVNNAIGSDAYDVGHVFTLSCTDVGGVASLGSVCSFDRKAAAVTCHYSSNLNYIITNVMAHEMGHQFSASHTFNNCNGNESAGNDYEPGGGTTIMAYCGLCQGNNVDYQCLENFHAHSVEQVMNFTRNGGGNSCATILSSGNTAPVVELDYMDGFRIPIATPFKLEGSAYDCEGDDLTYSWEQWDLGPWTEIGNPIGNSPLFTAMEPVDVPYRYFPQINKIVNNFNNNAELLPTYSRKLSFRFIARDNNELGGGTAWDNVSFRADDSAGPFYVIFPSQVESFDVGQEIEVTWEVAGTDNDIINCQNVNIWLSTDAGYNYTELLKYNTPNDGSEKVYIPNTPTTFARIMVEAADNVFFDISNRHSKIQEPAEPAFYMEAGPLFQQVCLPDVVEIDISTAGFNDFPDSLHFEVGTGLPEGALVEFLPAKVKPGADVTMQVDLTAVNIRDYYTVEILGISGEDTLRRTVEMDVVTNDYSDLEIINPAPGSTGMSQLFDFEWTQSQSADRYNVFLSTTPTFDPEYTLSLLNSQDTSYRPSNTLEKSTVYFWKIEGVNECGSRMASDVMTFSTEAFSCKTFASTDLSQDIKSLQTTTSVINIAEDTPVADVNIAKIAGDHGFFNDLEGRLEGPDGTTILLWSGKCFGYNAVQFNFGMDDESTSNFKCPPDQGVFYPYGSLGEFNGKSAQGDWKLHIYDKTTPYGGDLDQFELEICANIVLSNPYMVNNVEYQVAIGTLWNLPSLNLKADDDDNTAEELVYTLTDLPNFASLINDGQYLALGDTFTEQDVRDGKLQFFSNGDHGVEDYFEFIITDGTGGWLDKTKFYFVHDQFVGTEQANLQQQIKLFPNPASEEFSIQVFESGSFQLEMIDMQGKVLINESCQGFSRKDISLLAIPQGVYYVRVSNNQAIAVSKLVKQ